MDGSVLGSRHLGCSRSSSLPRDRFSRFAPRIRSLWDTKVPSPTPAAPPAAHGAAGTIAPPGVIPRSSRRRCRASPPAWGGPSHKPRFRGGDRGIRSQGAPPAPRLVCKPWRRPRPLAGEGAGAYITSSRRSRADAKRLLRAARRTLKTGYCDRGDRRGRQARRCIGRVPTRGTTRQFLSESENQRNPRRSDP